MAPEVYQRARQVFDQALDCPEAERKAFVDSATAGTLRSGKASSFCFALAPQRNPF